ncbi:hypothetical protein HLB23_39905 [Nocardia uniformis]|uniref:Toprim domain-containing protein n=1 Tax=Nocardia uniformis TaxID=53432 RepID=A0A849CAT5_9NOCA|nr:toprim domain-containing protein [Nocardia uniformis]NNH75953.1 hypothetical protein [Nocardia uniformis]
MGTNRSWDTITDALDRISGPGRHSGDWMRYLCPVHEGDGRRHHPSLGVIYDRQRGRTVIRCFAGCSDEHVLERLGLGVRDLFDHPRAHTGSAPRRRSERSVADRAILAAGLPLAVRKADLGRQIGRPRRVAVYVYERPDGRPEGRVHRMRIAHAHGHAKSFWQQRMTETGWRHGGFARIPYRLPELIPAVRSGADIFVCEGEHDVLTARRCGLFATCNAGGALGWHPDHAAWLRGAHRVIIVADRDGPGYRRAARVAATLLGAVEQIRIVQARDGNDLTDHCNAGHQVSELDPVPLLDEHYRRRSTADGYCSPGMTATARTSSGGTAAMARHTPK